MADTPVGLIAPVANDERPVKYSLVAEEVGYDSIWTGEYWPNDALIDLVEIACRTEEVGVGTAIVNVYSRSPAVLAMAALTLSRLSGGRFVLGLGASTPRIVEGLHGMEYDRPLRRIHETVELVKRFSRGEAHTVEYDGDLFDVGDFPSIGVEFPIYNAALGKQNRRLTGVHCDGWLPHNVPFSALEDAFEPIHDAATEAGRDPDEIDVCPVVPAVVGEDAETARRNLAEHIAWYAGNSRAYNRAIAIGYPEDADVIYERWNAGNREAAIDAIGDEMLDDLGVAGTAEQARDRLRALLEEPLVDFPLVTIPIHLDENAIDRTVRGLAPDEL